MNTGDIPADFVVRTDRHDHHRRVVEIPMRDGVALHTVIFVPKDATSAPMLLQRTPYDATKRTMLAPHSLRAAMWLGGCLGDLFDAGYLIAVQDVRGKHASAGTYELVSDANINDAWDSIDWLVTNVPESNGRVATIGVSYSGSTTLLSMLDPHPALAAAVPINPLVDGWLGDDWMHNGAFRQQGSMEYLYWQTASVTSEHPFPVAGHDVFESWLAAGSAAAMAEQVGMDGLPAWRRLLEHPDYDDYWQQQALQRRLPHRSRDVPTLLVHSQWDAEDIDGVLRAHVVLPHSRLVIGPWRHGGACSSPGDTLGALRFGSETGERFRQEMLIPFLDEHLRDAGPCGLAPVTAFETGSNTWRTHDRWPASTGQREVFLSSGGQLTLDEPVGDGFEEYVSDPAKPVPYYPRPIRPCFADGSPWSDWLVVDQRFACDRPDVLVYTSERFDKHLRLAGAPTVHLRVSTSGTDADWIVKLIDVFPDEVPRQTELGGYQLAVAMDVLRARYRDDPSTPTPMPVDQIVDLTFTLPHVVHAFAPGHRLMVQVQSSWFPLYDRNPQTFVPRITDASPEDYVAATHRVHRGSRIVLPTLD